jgi:endoglucanase
MKTYLPLILAIVSVSPSTALGQGAANIYSANQKLGRGINLGNALDGPKEGEWGVTLKAEYFQWIKNAGFQTVRLPVRWSAHAEETAPYTIDVKFAERVDWAIAQALNNKLNIIVNVHHYDAMDAAPDEHLPRLEGLWKQIAAKDQPAEVYFELYNEPHDKFTEDKWNPALRKLLAAVRATNPTRPVIIGPTFWNNISALEKLDLPRADHNLIVSIHYYDPFKFTHQGAFWIKDAAPKGRLWTSTDAEQADVRKSFIKAATWAKANDVPVFLGEFGANDQADMPSRARWTSFVCREAERQGFSWAYWEFCSYFGAFDQKAGVWREPLKMALVPPPECVPLVETRPRMLGRWRLR